MSVTVKQSFSEMAFPTTTMRNIDLHSKETLTPNLAPPSDSLTNSETLPARNIFQMLFQNQFFPYEPILM